MSQKRKSRLIKTGDTDHIFDRPRIVTALLPFPRCTFRQLLPLPGVIQHTNKRLRSDINYADDAIGASSKRERAVPDRQDGVDALGVAVEAVNEAGLVDLCLGVEHAQAVHVEGARERARDGAVGSGQDGQREQVVVERVGGVLQLEARVRGAAQVVRAERAVARRGQNGHGAVGVGRANGGDVVGLVKGGGGRGARDARVEQVQAACVVSCEGERGGEGGEGRHAGRRGVGRGRKRVRVQRGGGVDVEKVGVGRGFRSGGGGKEAVRVGEEGHGAAGVLAGVGYGGKGR